MTKPTFAFFAVLFGTLMVCLCSVAATTAPANSTTAQARPNEPPAQLVLDALNSTCGPQQAAIVRRAIPHAHEIAHAAERSRINASAPAFVELFGRGWAGGNYSHIPAMVFENLRIASVALGGGGGGRDGKTPPAAKLVDVTCVDESRQCSMTVPAYTDLRNATGRQVIVLCPLFFIQGSVLRYLAQCRPTSVQGSHWYRETILLHEVMHLDGVGYRTAFSDGRRGAPERVLRNPNHSMCSVLFFFHPFKHIFSLHLPRGYDFPLACEEMKKYS